ncbi:Uncharacterized protein Fot_14699 [Forsythia ovata]|uniref:Uncharacterized protein n=1 Tax=Forsythia ovata TaxID=205694 RepID=A0ABD1W7G2_9LAMI
MISLVKPSCGCDKAVEKEVVTQFFIFLGFKCYVDWLRASLPLVKKRSSSPQSSKGGGDGASLEKHFSSQEHRKSSSHVSSMRLHNLAVSTEHSVRAELENDGEENSEAMRVGGYVCIGGKWLGDEGRFFGKPRGLRWSS